MATRKQAKKLISLGLVLRKNQVRGWRGQPPRKKMANQWVKPPLGGVIKNLSEKQAGKLISMLTEKQRKKETKAAKTEFTLEKRQFLGASAEDRSDVDEYFLKKIGF